MTRSSTRISFVAGVTMLLATSVLILPGCGDEGQKGAPSAEHNRPWQRLPPPPAVPEHSTFVAANDQLLLFGGCAHDYRDRGGCGRSKSGFAFSLGAKRWEAIPPAPRGISGEAIWTGNAVIVLSSSSRRPAQGLAYDPEAKEWRELPPGPIRSANAEAVWTGSEVVAWGGEARNGSGDIEGAAYDPTSNTWRRIARAPISLNLFDLAWTGSEVIAFGSQLDRGNGAATKNAVGAAYDPVADSWRRLPPSRLSPQATSASWLEGQLIAYDYLGAFQRYDPTTDRWSKPERMPLDPGECYPDALAAAGIVVAFYCGQMAVFDPKDGKWSRVDGGLAARLHDSIPVWRFSQLASMDDDIYFLAEGITFGNGGEARYGFADSPHSFWSLRP